MYRRWGYDVITVRLCAGRRLCTTRAKLPPPSAATNLDGSLGLSFVAYQIVIVAAEIVRLICGAHRPRTYRLALGRRLTTFLSPGLLKLRQLLVTDSPRNTRTRRSSRLYVSATESI